MVGKFGTKSLYNGTVITASLPNTVLSTPSHIGPRLFVQTSSYLDRNNYILGLPLLGVTTQAGSLTDFKLNWTINLMPGPQH